MHHFDRRRGKFGRFKGMEESHDVGYAQSRATVRNRDLDWNRDLNRDLEKNVGVHLSYSTCHFNIRATKQFCYTLKRYLHFPF